MRRRAAVGGCLAPLILAMLPQAACDKRGSAPPSFDCEALQKRAERCEGAILELVRQRYHVEKVTAGTSPAEAEQLFRRFKVRFQKRIRQRVLEGECRNLAHPRDQTQRRRASALRFCYSRPDCKTFGKCLLSQ